MFTETSISESDFNAINAWGLLSSIDLYNCDADSIRDPKNIEAFVIELCDAIGVKRYGEPEIVRFGKDPRVQGYSLAQLIETSLVSGHFAEESNAVYLDVFSCKYYDSKIAVEIAKKYFKPDSHKIYSILRR